MVTKVLGAIAAALLILLAGVWFYGTPPPADATRDQNWQRSDESTSYGIVDVHQFTYDGGTVSGAIVATVGNFPLVDEGSYVDDVVQRVAEKKGITLENPRSMSLAFDPLGVELGGTRYDARQDGNPVPVDAAVFDFPCPDGEGYVIAVGYGKTDVAFGGSPTFGAATDLVSSVTCG